MKKFNVLLLIVLFSIAILNGFKNKVVVVNALNNDIKKIYCNATLDDDFAEDRILVVLNDKVSSNSKKYSNSDFLRYDCERVNELTNSSLNKNNKQVLCLNLKSSSKENVLKTIDKLMKRDDVLYAGVDYKISAATTIPNDYNPSAYVQWAIDDISLPQAWDFTTGSSKIKVGILDTGIEGIHPDLQASILKEMCRDFTTGEEVLDPEPIDAREGGHGTQVAGIIGAIGNNGPEAISTHVGINWNVGLISLRILDKTGHGYSSWLAKAIQYASESNIPVLNLSAGWYTNSSMYDFALETVIKSYDGLLVCAATNQGRNNDGDNPAYPASFTLDNIISVGAIDKNINLWENSNYGAKSVDLFAPGKDVHTTAPNRTYAEMSATSIATPHVSGVAALLLSINPSLSATELKEAILNTVDIPNINGVNPLQGYCVTNGKLNAYKAVKYVLQRCLFPSYQLECNKSISSRKGLSNDSYFTSKNAMLELDISNSMLEFNITSTSPINVMLYDNNINEIDINKIVSNNDCTVKIEKNLSSGIYYLRANYIDKQVSGIINIDVHGHNYEDHYCTICNNYTTMHDYHEPYTWVNYTKHKASCGCGAITQQGHVIANSTLASGKKYATCLLCKGKAEMGFTPIDSFDNEIEYVTDNKSYILRNGIIVLVDEDVELFFKGNLRFYKRNTDLVW